MEYIFFRVRKKLQHNCLTYSLILAEIIAGFFLLLIGVNTAISLNEKCLHLKQQIQPDSICIQAYSREINTDEMRDGAPVTYDDYRNLIEIFNGIEPNFLAIQNISVLVGSDSIKTVPVVFLSNNYAKHILDIDMTQKAVYVGQRIVDDLKNDAMSLDEWFIIQGSKVATGQNPFIPIKEIPQKNNKALFITPTLEIAPENCIFVPVEFLPNHLTSGISLLQIENGSQLPSSTINQGIEYLTKLHGDTYSYHATKTYIELEKKVEDFTQTTDLLSGVAVLLFFIVTFGLIGVMLIFLSRRKNSIAISLTLGADLNITVLELFLEVFALYFIGACIASIAAFFVLPMFSNVVSQVSIHNYTILFVFALSVFCSLLVCMSIFSEIRKLQPAKILSEER